MAILVADIYADTITDTTAEKVVGLLLDVAPDPTTVAAMLVDAVVHTS